MTEAEQAVAAIKAVNHYIETQMALGNWPGVWSGDEALLASVDTYEAIAVMRRWDAELGSWDD